MDMWLTGADLTPLRENVDKIVYPLTQWKPKVTQTGITSAGAMLKFEGKDYEEAFAKFNAGFLQHMWGDGLPLMPPTEARVNWILTGTDLPRETLVGSGGQIMPKGGKASVENIAISLAMAGGRPEYLPLLIAAVEAIDAPPVMYGHRGWVSTTHSPIPLLIVNGPIGRQLRITPRYGALGPDPRFPAGGVIGRAIRLILMILGGAINGVGTMAIFGHMRYTNAVLAEDEKGLEASGWTTFAEDRGFAKGTNVATVIPASSFQLCQLHQSVGPTPEDEQTQWLRRLGGDIGAGGHFGGFTPAVGDEAWEGEYGMAPSANSTSGVVVMGYNMAKVLSEFGWTKDEVKEFIRENAVPTWDDLIKYGRKKVGSTPKPITIAPVLLAIAGGDQSNQALVVRGGTVADNFGVPESREIKLPANWDALLAEAEKDLGPIPTL
jgi:hypothetical protein